MASNGIVFRPGRGPSFILVGLVVIVIILFYSYWGVSSKNNKLLRDVSVLQDRLRVLAARKLTADKKGSALVSQITQMQEEKEKVINSKDSELTKVSNNLQTREAELKKLREQERGYQAELEKLKRGVNSSSSDLKMLKEKADQLLKSYKEMKEKHSLLQQQITNLTSARDVCQKELEKVKMELDQQKKTQDVPSDENVSNKTNDAKKVKVTDEGQSVDEGSDKDKESVKNDENEDDKNTESSKEVKENNPRPSRGSANQDNVNKAVNVSALPSVPGNIKTDGNKSQSEETGKSGKTERGNEEPEENTEQPSEESQEENKDEANDEEESEKETKKAASDKEKTQEENGDDRNKEDEKGDEESDDDLDNKGMNLAAGGRRRMLPLPGESLERMASDSQRRGSIEETRNLARNNMDTQGMLSRRFSPLGIPDKLDEARKRKEAEEVEDQ